MRRAQLFFQGGCVLAHLKLDYLRSESPAHTELPDGPDCEQYAVSIAGQAMSQIGPWYSHLLSK
jgi:hypothetical protein